VTARAHPAASSGGELHGGAAVVWNGDLRRGEGTLRLGLGAGGELPLLWPESEAWGPGATSPEELASAAHAACFTMTLAHVLTRGGHLPRELATQAQATFGVVDGVRKIRRSQLDVEVAADGLDDAELARAAELSGRTCPVSNSYAAAGVELDVRVSLAAAA
jgi:osmotically inducible protein OsmC